MPEAVENRSLTTPRTKLTKIGTKAFAKASTTMTKVDPWHARLALKTLRLDQREAIAEAAAK